MAISGNRSQHHNAHIMNATLSQVFMQRWHVVQHELIPYLGDEIGQLTSRLEKLIRISAAAKLI